MLYGGGLRQYQSLRGFTCPAPLTSFFRENSHFLLAEFRELQAALAISELSSGRLVSCGWCVMPTRALRAPTSNGVRVARRGLHAVDLHSLGGIRVCTARFESTTPKVPGGTRPLYTLQRKFSKCMSILARFSRFSRFSLVGFVGFVGV